MHSDYRKHFLIPSDITYLNAAYMSPMPISSGQMGVSAIESRTAAVWKTNPVDFVEPSEKLRGMIAGLWGVMPRNVALVPSVSYGVEIAVKNFKLPLHSEILVPKDDFPSNVYPWMSLCSASQTRIRYVSRPADFDWTAAFINQMETIHKSGGQVGVVSVPACDWSDGTRFDIPTLSAYCRKHGSRLVVDVSQAFGAVPISVADYNADFVFSVGYKWQLGPYGLSYLFVADQWLEGAPLENAWLNRRGSDDFARLVEYQNEFQDGARRFDSGQRSQFHLTPMATESARLLKEATIPAIFSHVNGLVKVLHEQLAILGFSVPPLTLLTGHMVGARHRNWPDMAPLVKRLREQNVFVSARGDAMRISPHLYNDLNDIDRFIAIIAKELGLVQI